MFLRLNDTQSWNCDWTIIPVIPAIFRSSVGITNRKVYTKGFVTLNSRYSSSRQPHLIGAGLIAAALGTYYFASQSGLLLSNPRVEQTEAATGAFVADGELPAEVPEMPSSFGAMPETGTDLQVLPPADSLVSYRNGTDQQVPLQANSNAFPDGGRPSQLSAQGDIQVYFSPKGGCTSAIVGELNRAQRQILIQAYSFTSEPIAAACVAAHNRGVQVFAVLDKSQETEQYSAADFLANSGIPTMIDAQHAIAHNKVILIDGTTLITGSFNFTTNAEQSNAENLLIIRNRPDLYSVYEKNMQNHFSHSKKYVARATAGRSATRTNHGHESRK